MRPARSMYGERMNRRTTHRPRGGTGEEARELIQVSLLERLTENRSFFAHVK